MMSLRAIAQLADEAEAKAKAKGTLPVIWNPDIWKGDARGFARQIPFIGDWIPRGWKRERELFVDSSGFGALDEPALTFDQFERKLEPGKAYAVTQAGQFQVYVGVFVPPVGPST